MSNGMNNSVFRHKSYNLTFAMDIVVFMLMEFQAVQMLGVMVNQQGVLTTTSACISSQASEITETATIHQHLFTTILCVELPNQDMSLLMVLRSS